MGGLFGGGKSSPPPPAKAGDAIERRDSDKLNTEEYAKRTAVGAAGEEAKKATSSLLGDDASTSLVGDVSKPYG